MKRVTLSGGTWGKRRGIRRRRTHVPQGLYSFKHRKFWRRFKSQTLQNIWSIWNISNSKPQILNLNLKFEIRIWIWINRTPWRTMFGYKHKVRVRADILRAVAMKNNKPGQVEMYVAPFSSRPVLRIKDMVGSRPPYALTFADAITRYWSSLVDDDLAEVYRVCSVR